MSTGSSRSQKVYEVWKSSADNLWKISSRSNMQSMDDELIAEHLTDEEMWSLLKVIERPSTVIIETE